MHRLLRLLNVRRRHENSDSQRGQALPLFVLMIFVITGSVAVVTDVSWFWVNGQRMQRAADAAALAGAVFLPGDAVNASAAALASAKQNGYDTATTGVTVTAVPDLPKNPRRLIVKVSGPVTTFFARVFGITTVTESATAKGEFTLPVPMGSPQNWYGVGDFWQTKLDSNTTTNTTTGNSGWNTGTASTGTWTNPGSANASDDNAFAVSTATTGSAQEWKNFNLLPSIAANQTLTILGLEVDTRDVLTGSGTSTDCQLAVALSWDGGVTYNGTASQTIKPLNTSEVDTRLGTTASFASWGTHPWKTGDFSDFRVRLTFNKPTCGGTRTVSVDTLQVRMSWSMATDTTTTTMSAPFNPAVTGCPAGAKCLPSPTGGAVTSQGFWGALITSGGSRENGDQFSPINDNGGIAGHTSANPDHTTAGYDYTVIVGANGQVQLFDPTFCETGANTTGGGDLGAGDHWIGNSPNAVTTVFSLWSTIGIPAVPIVTTNTLFANQIGSDQGSSMGVPNHRIDTNPAVADCSTNAYHNKWYQLASGLQAGKYRLNVNTSSAGNNSTNAENMWSAWVSSDTPGAAKVYGMERMATYNNMVAGAQVFYLAQIGKENAGKTLEITLFDPGDLGSSGNASLRLLSPNGTTYSAADFTYIADNGRKSTSTTQSIQIASNGSSLYNDSVIVIEIALPASYGASTLTPNGETEAGWWKVEYNVTGGNDTITWQVAIKGSPVHLVP